MRISELRDMSLQELEDKSKHMSEELFNLRIKHSLNQLDNPLQLRNVRRALARKKCPHANPYRTEPIPLAACVLPPRGYTVLSTTTT